MGNARFMQWNVADPDYSFHTAWELTFPFTHRAENFVQYIHLSHAGFKPPSDLNVPLDPGGLPL